jgi:hypothetical protein
MAVNDSSLRVHVGASTEARVTPSCHWLGSQDFTLRALSFFCSGVDAWSVASNEGRGSVSGLAVWARSLSNVGLPRQYHYCILPLGSNKLARAIAREETGI